MNKPCNNCTDGLVGQGEFPREKKGEISTCSVCGGTAQVEDTGESIPVNVVTPEVPAEPEVEPEVTPDTTPAPEESLGELGELGE